MKFLKGIGIFFIVIIGLGIIGNLIGDDDQDKDADDTTVQTTDTTEPDGSQQEASFDEQLTTFLISEFGEYTDRKDNSDQPIKILERLTITDDSLVVLLNLNSSENRDDLLEESNSMILMIASFLKNALPSSITVVSINTFNDHFTTEMNGNVVMATLFSSRIKNTLWDTVDSQSIPEKTNLYFNNIRGKLLFRVFSFRTVYDELFDSELLVFDIVIRNETEENQELYTYYYRLVDPDGASRTESLYYESNEKACSIKLIDTVLEPGGETTCMAAFEFDSDGEYSLKLFDSYLYPLLLEERSVRIKNRVIEYVEQK